MGGVICRMIITLAICDSDIEYLTRLMNFIKRDKSYNIEVCIFTCTDGLEDFLRKGLYDKISILINESLISDNNIFDKYQNYYILTEEQYKVSQETNYLFKYQKVGNIFNSIISSHIKEVVKYHKKFSGNKKRILTIFDTNTHLAKLKLTWLISYFLSRSKKVLLILLDSYNIPVINNNNFSEPNLSELIYHIKEKGCFCEQIEQFIKKQDNITYIAGTTHFFDLLSVTEEDISNIILDIKNETDYDEIVFYSNFINDTIYKLINLSDILCIPIIDNVYEKELLREWERQFNFNNIKKEYRTIIIDENDLVDKSLDISFNSSSPLEKYAINLCDII